MTTSLLPPPSQQFLDSNGDPLSGGKVYFYEPGTTTPKTVYSDSTGLIALTNPVILDSAGRASIWLSGFYKVRLDDSLDNTIYTVDNVSSQYSQTLTSSQWITQTDVLTYISATQFSVPGDKTGDYHAGRRIQAVVSAGTITGTITASAAAGSPIITTVTVIWDSGSLDSGLSSISLGVLTVTAPSGPIPPIIEKTANYAMAVTDINRTIVGNSASNFTITLVAANAVPSGTWQRIKNANTGIVTVVGTVEGVANLTLGKSEDIFIWSNGTAWSARLARSILISHCNQSISFGGNVYLATSGLTTANVGQATIEMLSPMTGIVRNLYAKADVNSLNANTSVILQVERTGTSLATAIFNGSTAVWTDLANTVIITKGQRMNYVVDTSGSSSGSMTDLSIGMELEGF